MDASERRKRAGQEAAEWWVVLQGEASRAQRAQYVDWLRESPVHVAEMLRMAQIHGTLDHFERWAQIPVDGADAESSATVIPLQPLNPSMQAPMGPAKPMPARGKLVWSAMAVLVLALVMSAVFWPALDGRIIQTERGERREISLPDGSLVQVDPETRLRVKYAQATRRVVLLSGRALFRVAKNPHRPFLVQTENTIVRAVGTAFAVERQSKSVIVTVAQGKVAVSRSSMGSGETRTNSRAPTTTPAASGGSAENILLTANQQVVVAASGNPEAVRNVDSARALAWAEGRLIFVREPVSEAVRQFNRYNRIQIYVKDSDLARRPISGVFSAADPESFVAFIETVTAVQVTRSASSDITIDRAK
jgi:transmembrane sensor